jgi:3-oxoacyl-[acyl-carrier protein] reductase
LSKIAVVTGAGSGIGRAVARQLASDGFAVVATDIDEAAAQRTAAEFGGPARRVDVTDPESVQVLADELGRVDALVNNAGIWKPAPLAGTTPEHFRAVMEVNVLGTVLCTQVLVPLMPAGSAVVNLTSLNAATAAPGFGIYPATKAAIVALTRQASLEWSAAGIRVNAVGPGLVRTEATEPLFTAPTSPEAFAAVIPAGRLGAPEDVASAVSFLVSSAAAYITGQVLYVDGGIDASLWRLLWRATTAAGTAEV